MNTVGNTFSSMVTVGGTYYPVDENVVVTNNNGGVITLQVTATLPSTPLTNLIPAGFFDQAGHINTEIKFKNTSEGIVDYFNADGKPFLLVNYNASVGDKYTCTKSDGSTITRKVTAKSTTDDYPWGLMYIKTVTVEQDSRIPGVSKIIYNANHKFGLVGIELVMEDGTSTKIALYPANY
jgi:hypothetical protein